MRVVLGAMLLVLALTACTTGDGQTTRSQDETSRGEAQAASAGQPRADAAPLTEGVTVTGVGRVRGRPDVLRATVGVEVERPGVQEALTIANERADQVIAALRDAGVEERDIQTREFTVQPRMEHRPNEPPTLRGYAVRNLLDVELRDLDRVGEVLGRAVEAGGDAARVHGVHFALEDDDEQLRAARDQAFQEARAKAEQYAELAGRALGELQTISETSAPLPPVLDMAAEEAARGGAAAAPPIEPGEQELTVRVTAVWSLE